MTRDHHVMNVVFIEFFTLARIKNDDVNKSSPSIKLLSFGLGCLPTGTVLSLL